METKVYRKKQVEDKRYYCEEHDIAFRDNFLLENHMNGLKHHPKDKKVHKLDLEKHYEYRKKIIEEKIFYCAECDKAFRDKYSLKTHLDGLRHHPERKVKYTCTYCNYETNLKVNMTKHKATKKHQKNTAEI